MRALTSFSTSLVSYNFVYALLCNNIKIWQFPCDSLFWGKRKINQALQNPTTNDVLPQWQPVVPGNCFILPMQVTYLIFYSHVITSVIIKHQIKFMCVLAWNVADNVWDDETQRKGKFGNNVIWGMLGLPVEDMHSHQKHHNSKDTKKRLLQVLLETGSLLIEPSNLMSSILS